MHNDGDRSFRSICVLIADDEESTRKGLQMLIPWDKLGVDRVEVAQDGENALLMAREIHPDLVISDIRMPRMNGITFAEQLKEQYPDSRLIFISGYSDKEYLKTAIHLQAVSYVEKPLDPQEIISAVTEAVRQIIRSRMLYLSADRSYLLLKDAALELTNPLADISIIKNIFAALFPDFLAGHPYRSLIIYADCRESLLRAALESIFPALLLVRHAAGFYLVHIAQSENRLGKPETTLHDLQRVFGKLGEDANSTFIAAGQATADLDGLAKSFHSAKKVADALFYEGFGKIAVSELQPERKSSFTRETENDFLDILSVGNREQTEQACHSLIAKVRQANLSVQTMKELFTRVNAAIIARVASLGQTWDLDQFREEIAQAVLYDQLCEQLRVRIADYFRLLGRLKMERPVVLAIQYIEAHYHDNELTLEKIAQSIHLSVPYICRIFKEETGKTFNAYLSDYRIVKAKQLLDDHAVRISEISALVGCSSANYFTRLFRKKVGASPSEYRSRYQR